MGTLLQVGTAKIKTDSKGMVSLNDLYEAATLAGMADNKLNPRQWKDRAGSETIEFTANVLNVAICDVYKSIKGKGGGSYAHMQIALAYAKYLSPGLHYQVNETYLRAKTGDITLADEIVDKASPDDVAKHMVRTASKVTRNEFTGTLSTHGVHTLGYGMCTNAIYIPLLGGKASEIRQQRNLPVKANVRESMSAEEIILTAHAELLATRNIKATRAYGNDDCASVCKRAAERIASL